MADKRESLDVWIVESNTVYREVPFEVVADWVQQGRLLEDDMLRPSGTAEWYKLGAMPAFAAYLPRAEPARADDQAEALEPVEAEFSWKRPHAEEDDDVDMIPLIDVSLVLLIFFMLATTGAAVASAVQTPSATFGWVSSNETMIWIGIDMDGDGNPVYSIGQGNTTDEGNLLAQEQVLAKLDQKLRDREGPSEVIIKAHEDLPSGVVLRLTVELDRRRDLVIKKYAGVRDRGGP